MNKYNVVFESDNILYVQVDKKLINDYLIMINDPDVQKKISHVSKVYTYEQELNWINEKLSINAPIFSMIEKKSSEFIGTVEIMRVKNGIGEIGVAITPTKQNIMDKKQ